jgi:hypothetical protein
VEHLSKYNPESLFSKAVLRVLEEMKECEPDKFFDLMYTLPKNLNEKIGWCLPESALEKLYDLLLLNRFVSCSSAQFVDVFLGTHFPGERIIWQADLTELVYMYYRLRTEEIVPDIRNPHTLTVLLFHDKYGKSINPRSLIQTLHKVMTSGKKHEKIDNILSIMISLKEKC